MKMVLVFLGSSALLILIGFLAVGGVMKMIDNPSCHEIYSRAQDRNFRVAVLEWADGNVMEKVFLPSDYTVGHYSGPVVRAATLNVSRARVQIPEWLSGYEIRIVGNRKKPAELIYIGMGRYRGLFVGKSDLSHYSGEPGFKLDNMKHDGRIGVVCYEER